MSDREYPMSPIAVEYYKNGPSLLGRYLPFRMTVYAQRAIAALIAMLLFSLRLAWRLGCIFGLLSHIRASYIDVSEPWKMSCGGSSPCVRSTRSKLNWPRSIKLRKTFRFEIRTHSSASGTILIGLIHFSHRELPRSAHFRQSQSEPRRNRMRSYKARRPAATELFSNFLKLIVPDLKVRLATGTTSSQV